MADHQTKRTPENLLLFVETLRASCNVSEACRRVGVSRTMAYQWRDEGTPSDADPGAPVLEVTLVNGETLPFGVAWRDAIEEAVDELEAAARRYAVEGYREPVVHQGEMMYMRYPPGHRRAGDLVLDRDLAPVPLCVNRPNARLHEILLKAHRPERFRDNLRVDATVSGGVMVVPGSPEDWAKAAEDQQEDYR